MKKIHKKKGKKSNKKKDLHDKFIYFLVSKVLSSFDLNQQKLN